MLVKNAGAKKPAASNRPLPTVSLCMIVKDEEAHLPACLKSVQGVVDEVIVVDTGSTDRTKEIAKDHGAQVFDLKWKDDFSAARNFAIEKATMDWVLIMDADDTMPEWTRVQLKTVLLKHKKALGLSIQILQDRSGFTFNSVRLFKNHLNIRYKRPIHEQVYFGDARENVTMADIPLADLTIVHRQFHEDVSDVLRAERNIRLLKKAVKKDPGDHELYFYLGQEEMIRGNTGPAMKHLLHAIDMYAEMPAEALVALRARSMFPYALRDLMKLCIIEEELEDTISLFEWAKELIPDYADMYYIAATAKQRMKEYEAAAALFEDAMKAAKRGSDFAVEPKLFSNSYRGMGSSYYYAKDLTKAKKAFLAALKEDPSDVESVRGLTYVLKERYGKNDVLAKIGKAVDIKDKSLLDAVVAVLNE